MPGRLNMASCEGASSQVSAEKMGEWAEEKLDELATWHTSLAWPDAIEVADVVLAT